MARIHKLEIENFRGIKSFSENFRDKDFLCLVGRGDSCKSTILEAIAFVLSPSYSIPVTDADFYDIDSDKDIFIRVYLYDIPERFRKEEKFGGFMISLDNPSAELNGEEEGDIGLCVELHIAKDLEPEWNIICPRHTDDRERRSISGADRGLLGAFKISEFLTSQFSWGKYSPLTTLLSDDERKIDLSSVCRDFRNNIPDVEQYKLPEEVTDDMKNLGLNIGSINSKLDPSKFNLKEASFILHDEKIPLSSLGKGSRRLASIAIQRSAMQSEKGILLIDEIEQGLEPDRVKHLSRSLLCDSKSQTIITSHSPCVLEEIPAEYIFVVHNNEGVVSLSSCSEERQGVLRACPEAFYAKKVIVCEGATEVGICRALEGYFEKNFSLYGVVYTDGGGDNFLERAEGIKKSGIEVILFYDGDKLDELSEKIELFKLKFPDIEHLVLDEGDSIEDAVFKYMPIDMIKDLLIDFFSMKIGSKFKNAFLTNVGEIDNITDSDIPKIIAWSKREKKEAFKRIDRGEVLGEHICQKMFLEKEDNTLSKNLNKLIRWVSDEDGNK